MKFSTSFIYPLFIFIFLFQCRISKGQHKEIELTFLKKSEHNLYSIPFVKENGRKQIKTNIPGVSIDKSEVLTFEFIVSKTGDQKDECRECISDAGFVVDGCKFIVQNNIKDLRIYVGYGVLDELPYYIINRFTENGSFKIYIKKHNNEFEWVVESPNKTVGATIKIEDKAKTDLKLIYTPVEGNILSYFIGNPEVSMDSLPVYDSAELHPLFKYNETAISKYDWSEPAAKHLVLENIDGQLTKNEINGLKSYLLEYQLPTHNHMNYYFRKRMNSYMMEWLYKKTKEGALVDKAIQLAQRAIEYRNDNFGKYKISYNRRVAPLWPNYKEVEVYEDGSIGLVPGASAFAGLTCITVAIRIIAENQGLWEQKYNGVTYYNIALRLVDEALKTIDYTYDVFVGEDNLIRYPNTMLRKEWRGKVFIYNRVFPIISGSIPLVEAMEKFSINKDKIKQIDKVNQSMIDYLKSDMTFYGPDNVPYLKYPYSQAAQEKNQGKEQVEDFMHGSFDSRDFQLIYLSGRYNFNEKYIQAMANTLVERVAKGNGKFSDRMDGNAKAKAFKTPISYDGFIWYAKYRPEIYELIIHHIINDEISVNNKVWDAYCLYEILKLKDGK